MGKDIDIDSLPRIPEFYSGRSIFITGGTGFMGKILIEKLLRSCPGVDRIYLLLRGKHGKTPEERLPAIEKSELFGRLRNERPGAFQSKVFAVAGDVTELGLGLSEKDRAMLINKVSVIFHVAASVRFDDPLRDAVIMNLRGTRELLALAKELKELAALIHVSTSYSNTNVNPVEERVYPPHADWRDTISIAETLDEHTLRILTSKYLGELPNTYTFTKQLAEHVMYEQRGKMPIVIFRPSIVISTLEEPMTGWIENFNGPVGILVASGKGIMRSVYTKPELKSDYMPVDIAIKGMLVAAWKRGTARVSPADDIPVYHCCSGKLKDITMQELISIGRDIAQYIPLNDLLWTPGGNISSCPTHHYFMVIFFHLLPAIFVDLVLRMLGRKPILVKLQRRIYIANLALDYYITNQWTFNNDNFIELRSQVKEEDRELFYYQYENVDVYEFFKNCTLGGRRYLLNEPDDTIPQAMKHYRRMFILDKVVKVLFWTYIFYLVMNSRFLHSLANGIIDFFLAL